VASGPQPLRPPLQADPSAGSSCRVPPCPGTTEHVRREPFSGDSVDAFRRARVISLTAAFGEITLSSMKWLVVLFICAVGCGDDAPPTIPGSGTPIPPSNVGGTGGVGGAGGSGGAGGVGGGSVGACDNESDLDAIEGAGDSVRNIARICGLPNNMSWFCSSLVFRGPQYEECITECVYDEVPGLSPECAACYGALERCGVAQLPSCLIPCQQNICTPLCLDCLEGGGCIEEFKDCRGLPGDGCPDSR